MRKKTISMILITAMMSSPVIKAGAADNISYNISWKENNIMQISGTGNMPGEYISALVYTDMGFETGDVIYADQTVTDNEERFEFKTRINNQRGLKIKIGGLGNETPLEYFSKKTQKTVYLSDSGLLNANGGLDSPVASLQRAFDLAGENAKIQIIGKYTLNEKAKCPADNITICGGELYAEAGASVSGNISFRNIKISSDNGLNVFGDTVFADGVEFLNTSEISGEYLFFECEPANTINANAVVFKNGIKNTSSVTADYIVNLGDGGSVFERDGKLFVCGDDQRAASIDNAPYTEKETELSKGEHTVKFGYDFLLHNVYINNNAKNTYDVTVEGQANNLLGDSAKSSPVLFVGIYDDKKLIAVKTETVGANKSFDETFTFTDIDAQEFSVRVFLWDSFSRISPLTSVYITDSSKGGETEQGVIYVSPDGSDSAKGTFTDPMSLSGARNKARASSEHRTIFLRGGEYKFTNNFLFDKNDKNLTIKVYNGEKVVFYNSDIIPVSIFKKLPDGEVKNSIIDSNARDKILVGNIRDAGITNYGLMYGYELHYSSGNMAPTLTFDGKPGTIARYPNKDENGRDTYLTIQSSTADKPFNPGSTTEEFSFFVDDSANGHMSKWSENYDHWACGYLAYAWADGIYKGTFQKTQNGDYYFLSNNPYKYSPPVVGGRVFFQNILEELDSPGEWYLERPSGTLYIYPPEGFDENSEIRFTVNQKRSVEFSGSENITMSDIVFDNINVIVANNSDRILITNSEFTGRSGVDIKNSTNCGVRNNYFHDLPGSAVYVWDNGDSETLSHANNIVENNVIRSYAKVYKCYNPGISVSGVGNTVTGNEIYDAPHNAILFGGQMNTIELNYIHDVCWESADSGAIYAHGSYGAQGNVIRYNFFENINRNTAGYPNNAVYLDDLLSSVKVYGNVFYDCERAALFGGGRANEFYNNIVVNCTESIIVDARGTWGNDSTQAVYNHIDDLKNNMPYYNQGIWKEKFPHLANIESDEPTLPKYNKVYNNVFYESKPENIAEQALASGVVKNNITVSDKSVFLDYDNKVLIPSKESVIYKQIPEFMKIPFELIGKNK